LQIYGGGREYEKEERGLSYRIRPSGDFQANEVRTDAKKSEIKNHADEPTSESGGGGGNLAGSFDRRRGSAVLEE